MLNEEIKQGIIGLLIVLIGVILCFAVIQYEDMEDNWQDYMPLAPWNFTMPFDEIGNFTLGVGWQMVSMPENINKTDIYINYQEETYTWNEAVTNGYIANVIMSYDTGQYIETNYLLKTRGYWMYCFTDGIQISDESFVLYCGKLIFNATAGNVTCNKVVISPELYDNTIEYTTFVATDMYEFYYLGGDVLE